VVPLNNGPGVKYIGGKPRQWDTWPGDTETLYSITLTVASAWSDRG